MFIFYVIFSFLVSKLMPTCSLGSSCLPEDTGPCAKAPQVARIKVQLEAYRLWQQFDQLGTEMIVTKAGRLEQTFHHYRELHVHIQHLDTAYRTWFVGQSGRKVPAGKESVSTTNTVVKQSVCLQTSKIMLTECLDKAMKK